ncbi:protein of unknown function DUF669 [Rhizobium phage RHph_X3_2]|nr:protein of unknown function DUF669 [Rhizobium phage RHph_X3_2]
MVALNFNANQVQPNVALEAIPSGNYPVMITASTKKPTQKGDGAYIELEQTIQAGEYKGRKVYDRLNIENPNQTAVQIAYGTLSALCYVTGRMQITQTEQLHGVPFIAVVVKKPRNDQPDVMTNEIKGYRDINGNEPGKQGGPQGGAPQGGPAWGTNNGQPAQMNGQPPYQGQPQQQQMQPQQQPQQTQPQGQPWQDPNAAVGGGAPPWGGNQPQQGQPAQGNGAPQFDPNAPPPWAQQ